MTSAMELDGHKSASRLIAAAPELLDVLQRIVSLREAWATASRELAKAESKLANSNKRVKELEAKNKRLTQELNRIYRNDPNV